MCEGDFDNPDLTLEEMFRFWPETATIFFEYNMRCVGCQISSFHQLADACSEYGLDIGVFGSLLRKAAAGPTPGITPNPRSTPSDGDP